MICDTVVFIWARCKSGVISTCESTIKAPANGVRITPIQTSCYTKLIFAVCRRLTDR